MCIADANRYELGRQNGVGARERESGGIERTSELLGLGSGAYPSSNEEQGGVDHFGGDPADHGEESRAEETLAPFAREREEGCFVW